MARNNRFNGFPQPGQVPMRVPIIGGGQEPAPRATLRDRLGVLLSEVLPKSVKGLFIDYHDTQPAFKVVIAESKDDPYAGKWAEILVPTVLVARGGEALWDLLAARIDEACATLSEGAPTIVTDAG